MLSDHDLTALRIYYPETTMATRPPLGEFDRLELVMEPVPPEESLHQILADLNQRREIDVGLRGRITHNPNCGANFDLHPALLPRLRIRQRPYRVQLDIPGVRFRNGASVHPRARVVEPEISDRTFLQHPHLFATGHACPLSPHKAEWNWDDGLLGYLDQVAIWILKSEVWFWSGLGLPSRGIWLGPASGHQPNQLLRELPGGAVCHCGSGARYRDCHQRVDIHAAFGGVLQSHVRVADGDGSTSP